MTEPPDLTAALTNLSHSFAVAIEPLFPSLTEDASALGRYVAAHPNDDTARMAYIDALDECDASFMSAMQKMEFYKYQFMRQIFEGFGIPAHILNPVREEENAGDTLPR